MIGLHVIIVTDNAEIPSADGMQLNAAISRIKIVSELPNIDVQADLAFD